MVQDLPLEHLQAGHRLDTELVEQQLPASPVASQSIGLASGPVQGQDDCLPHRLSQRMSRQQALADLDDLPVTPQPEQQSKMILGDAETPLVEKAAGGRDEGSVGEVLQRRPAPQ